MSSFGIGLGGFIDGFAKGYGIRSDIEDRKLRNARLEKQDARQEKLDARTDIENQREDLEYNRALQQRNAVDAINTNAKTDFDAKVASGDAQPDQFEEFFTKFTLPKLKTTYLANGDVAGAEKLEEWGNSAAARQGAKLFSSALLKAQTGDGAGALAEVIKAGQVKGYIEHGYELESQEPLIDATTKKPIGYRLKVKAADGKMVEQDIRAEDLPRMIATFANPEAAWASHVAAAAEAKKRDDDLKTYRDKKEIDKAYGVGGANKGRSTAITALRKRLDGGLDGESQKFDDLPAAEKEKLISEELQLQEGASPGLGAAASAGPQRKVVVDTATGKAVDPKAVEAEKLKAASAQAVAQEQAKPQSRDDAVVYALGNAAERLKLGDNPQLIAQDLLNNGVPETSWPPELAAALKARTPAPGLGR